MSFRMSSSSSLVADEVPPHGFAEAWEAWGGEWDEHGAEWGGDVGACGADTHHRHRAWGERSDEAARVPGPSVQATLGEGKGELDVGGDDDADDHGLGRVARSRGALVDGCSGESAAARSGGGGSTVTADDGGGAHHAAGCAVSGGGVGGGLSGGLNGGLHAQCVSGGGAEAEAEGEGEGEGDPIDCDDMCMYPSSEPYAEPTAYAHANACSAVGGAGTDLSGEHANDGSVCAAGVVAAGGMASACGGSSVGNGAVSACAAAANALPLDRTDVDSSAGRMGGAMGGAHGAVPGSAGPTDHGLLRACCYVCMTPAAWAAPQVLRQRQLGFEHNLTTSHWPHEWMVIGGPVPDRPRNDPSRIDTTQRRLIGFDWIPNEHLLN
jgi:hypothetical protein